MHALDFFLAKGYCPAPWTFVEEIRKVPPASYLDCNETGVGETKRYWTVTGRPKLALSREQTAEQLGPRRAGDPSPGRIRRQDGALLSGGVDSALLVGCMASRTNADVETFTFRYGAYDGRYNEI
jgi:asparagine synthase (glutamine-hydrolysing)